MKRDPAIILFGLAMIALAVATILILRQRDAARHERDVLRYLIRYTNIERDAIPETAHFYARAYTLGELREALD